MKKSILIVLILAAMPFTVGFWERYNKTTGKDELIMIPTEKEKKIGASIAKAVEKKYKGVDDPLVQERFEAIGRRLAAVVERQDIIYHFKVLKSEDEMEGYNAFALPGGYVYMFETLMEFMGTDDEIAAITAHELAHINTRHSIKRLQGSYGMQALLLLAIGTGQNPNEIHRAYNALGQLMMAYSRQDEFEADRISVRYMKNAGFDPQGVVRSLEKMYDLRKKGPIRTYISIRSHPYLSERLANARTEVSGKTDFKDYINLPDSSREKY